MFCTDFKKYPGRNIITFKNVQICILGMSEVNSMGAEATGIGWLGPLMAPGPGPDLDNSWHKDFPRYC